MMSVALEAGIAPPPSGLPPTRNLAPRDVETLADALLAYAAEFAPLFRRAEQRHWAFQYLQGQLLELERKSIEPMALALADGDVQAMQQFISVGAWDAAPLLERHQALVAASLGDPATGVLIIDGCDFPKQGQESVGVAPQWCGALGKVANCQASVVACYASARGYTLVDRRLFLPERWFSAAYQDRRQRCGVPADQQPRTEPELAGELITTLHRRGVLPFQWVTIWRRCRTPRGSGESGPQRRCPPAGGGAGRPPGSGSGRRPRRRCGWTTWRSSSRRTSGRPP